MRATLSNYRQAPRKVRLVGDMIKGENVERALALLAHLPRRASDMYITLIKSALANAKQNHKVADTSALIVKQVRVDKGIVLKRRMPRARGSAFPIMKHNSHIVIEIGEPYTKAKDAKKAVKKEAK